jgi:hypothetical protein
VCLAALSANQDKITTAVVAGIKTLTTFQEIAQTE